MAYLKKLHLGRNIRALEVAFALDIEKREASTEEREILQKYAGFGGLKFVLNPAKNEEDKKYWSKSDLPYFEYTQTLWQLIRENSADERQFRQYEQSLKNSVLTAFYTPRAITDALAQVFLENNIAPKTMLDPSAGVGHFMASFEQQYPNVSLTAFEKDILTGKILSHLYPNESIHIEGFEQIEKQAKSGFDVVSSNIPFSDTAMFDLSYSRSENPAKVQAVRRVHTYFFLKGLDMLKEGGMLAFITSQGILDSPQNEIIRREMLSNARLVSALRLPNNLFSDYAGTEAGSDLIVLQKDSQRGELSQIEQQFLVSSAENNPYQITQNQLFLDKNRIIYTHEKLGTNLYGQPAMIYTHEQGVEGIATEMKQRLLGDFQKHYQKQEQRRLESLGEIENVRETEKIERIENLENQQEEEKIPKNLEYIEIESKLNTLQVADNEPLVYESKMNAPDFEPFSTAQKSNVNSIKQQNIQLSLFDFLPNENAAGNTAYRLFPSKINAAETSASTTKKTTKKSATKKSSSKNKTTQKIDLFSFSYETSTQKANEKKSLILETLIENPQPFEGVFLSHFKEDTLVEQKQTIGYLKEVAPKQQKRFLFLCRWLRMKGKK